METVRAPLEESVVLLLKDKKTIDHYMGDARAATGGTNSSYDTEWF
jgi:hypothetical protein